MWRVRFLPEIAERLVSWENPTGDITNSDLEMAGQVFGWLALEAVTSIKRKHVGVRSDNSATVGWQTKGGLEEIEHSK